MPTTNPKTATKKTTMVFGFYGTVRPDELTTVFGKRAHRYDFKKLRTSTYKGQWETGNIGNYLGLQQEHIERLHLAFFKSASRFKLYDQYDLCTVDNLFYQILFAVQNEFTKKNVGAIIFDVPPHATFEVVSHELAQILGIPTFVCLQSIFPEAFYIYDQYHSTDEGNKYLPSPEPPEVAEKHLKYSSEDLNLFYMQNLKRRSALWDQIGMNFVRSIHWRPLRRAKFSRNPTTFASDIALYRDMVRSQKFRKANLEDIKGEFVYVPLHLQPEATTSAIGAQYYNQYFMLNQLRGLLPSNIKIVIKENPKQGIYGRGLGFYNAISQINGLIAVQDNTNQHAIMKAAVATATITGTSGWEALRHKKPVIYFGNPWYGEIFGAFRAAENVFDAIKEFSPNEDQFAQSFRILQNKMFHGIVNKRYFANAPELSRDQNLRLLAQCFKPLLASTQS